MADYNPAGGSGSVSQNDQYSGVDAKAVTPSDTDTYTPAFRAIWVGTAGNVALVTKQGTTVTFTNVSGLLPVACTKVMATNTTASGITGIW